MIRFRAFPEQVGPKILWLERVDFFGTSEYLEQWSRKRRMLMAKSLINSADSEVNWSGVVNFHCMQMTLVLSVWFIFRDDRNDVPCSSRFFALWQ